MQTTSITLLIFVIIGFMAVGGIIGAVVAHLRDSPKVLGFMRGACGGFLVLLLGCLVISKIPWLNSFFYF